MNTRRRGNDGELRGGETRRSWLRWSVIAAALVLSAVGIAYPGPDDGDAGDLVIGKIGDREVRAREILERYGDEVARLAGVAPDDEPAQRRVQYQMLSRLRELLIEELMFRDAEIELGPDLERRRAEFSKKARSALIDRLDVDDEHGADRVLRERGEDGLEAAVRSQWRQALLQRRFQRLCDEAPPVSAEATRAVYERRASRYRPPARSFIRVVMTEDPATADRIDAALAAGTGWAEIVGTDDEPTPHVRSTTQAVQRGDLALALDDVLGTLAPGDDSPRVTLGGRSFWIHLDRIEPGTHVTLEQATPEIEQELECRRRTDLQTAYVESLLARGDFTPPDEMLRAILRLPRR